MKILIVEDERPAAKRIAKLIHQFRPSYQIIEMIDSVESAVQWLNEHPAPDLIFMDIQLADGLSFAIFSETEVTAPIVFTTAYDKYMQQAFKVNSIDYLLKPIDPKEIEAALNKFEKYYLAGTLPMGNANAIAQLLQGMTRRHRLFLFRGRFGFCL